MFSTRINAIIDKYRSFCLWFYPKNWYPETHASAVRALNQIQKNGDVAAFKEASKALVWLSQNFKDTSSKLSAKEESH